MSEVTDFCDAFKTWMESESIKEEIADQPIDWYIDLRRFMEEFDKFRAFAEQYETMASVWNACDRADWMYWMLYRTNYHNPRIVRMYAYWCARNVWTLLVDEHSRNAVRGSLLFLRDAIDEDQLRSISMQALGPCQTANILIDSEQSEKTYAYCYAAHVAYIASAPVPTINAVIKYHLNALVAAKRADIGEAGKKTSGAVLEFLCQIGKRQADKLRAVVGNPFN